MKNLGNVLTGLFHIAGLAVIAGMCIIRYMTDAQPLHPMYDLMLILAAVVMSAIHYLIFERLFYHRVRAWILSFFECAIAVAFVILIAVPNEILDITLKEGVVVLTVQLLIVSARVFSVVNNYRMVNQSQNV